MTDIVRTFFGKPTSYWLELEKLNESISRENDKLRAEIERLQALGRWIPVSEGLPEIIEKDGAVNSVFVKYKAEVAPDCGSEYSVSNTVYLSLHQEHFESWKYPEPPEDK